MLSFFKIGTDFRLPLMSRVWILFGCLLFSPPLLAQIVLFDSTDVVEMSQIVVTGTRSARPLANVPVATTLITAQEIRALGTKRLSDLLVEQLGITLVQDEHGTGLQLQGFDADYTLILIDGEPVIGRTAGTLDLDRITVSNIERVEIVRGPSSSLYGSEALAGVINLITKSATKPFDASLQTRFETHTTIGLTADTEVKRGRWGSRFFFDRLQSDGYDLRPELFGNTTPKFTQYTADARFDFEQNEKSTWNLGLRWSAQDQLGSLSVLNGSHLVEYSDTASRVDWSLAPSWMLRLSGRTKMTARAYASRFVTSQESRDQDGSEVYFSDRYDQSYAKGEAQFDILAGDKHFSTLGGGFFEERILGNRYEGAGRRTATAFLYAQDEWAPNGQWTVVGSTRLDYHTEYQLRFTPKVSLLYRPVERLRLRASVGSGFKAPDFRQLYLSFTNPLAGYNVFGSAQVAEGIARLEQEGQILELLMPIEAMETIRAESSWAYNVSVEGEPLSRMTARVNLFRNNVRDLIEWIPVAIKTNGQNVFSYTNLNRIYTQGLETEVTVKAADGLVVGIGYQYLDAKDREVLEQIDAGKIFTRENGRDRLVRRSDYGGLMTRSRHSGLFNLRYRNHEFGTTASLRGQFRGKYGYRDNNGNLILDNPNEYVEGYMVWNLTVTKSITDRLNIQGGANNLLDYTNPIRIPSLPGRLLFVGLQVDL